MYRNFNTVVGRPFRVATLRVQAVARLKPCPTYSVDIYQITAEDACNLVARGFIHCSLVPKLQLRNAPAPEAPASFYSEDFFV